MERDRLHRYADPSLDTVSNDVTQPRAGCNPLIPDAPLMREADGNGVHAHAETAVAQASTSSGSALPGPVMRKFEGSLGADLSAVRVHTGSDSESAAASVGARAYTIGQDIHFGRGQYDPSSERGEHLLAHEVAHTVQQSSPAAARKPMFKLEVSTPGDSHEVEADRAADAMVAGRAAQTSATTGVMRKLFRDFNDGWLEGAYTTDGVAERDWSAVAPSPQLPVGSWGGAPQYPEDPVPRPTRESGRAAFTADWFTAASCWNNLSARCAAIQGQSSVGVLTSIGIPSSVMVAEGTADASQSFVGTDLAFSPTDKSKLSPADIEALVAKKNEVSAAEGEVEKARGTIRKGLNTFNKGATAVQRSLMNINVNALEAKIRQDEQAIKQLERDKNMAVGAIQAGTSAVQGLQAILMGAATADLNMTMGGLSNLTGGLGKGAETAATRAFDNEINAIEGSISSSRDAIDRLAGQIEGLNMADAFFDMDSAMVDIVAGNGDLVQAQKIKAEKYLSLGNLMAAQAREADPIAVNSAEKLRAAVQAVPAIEKILSDWAEVGRSVALPGYSKPSGIGANQALNYGDFATHIAILRGAPEFVAGEIDIWTLRLNNVNAVIGK